MAEIVRATCDTDSFADKTHHRVKVSCSNVFSQLEVDVVNGIYLRKGDKVYVYTEGTWFDALVLGRCSGQLELQQLVDVINKIIDIINEDKSTFDNHIHTAGEMVAMMGEVPLPVQGNTLSASSSLPPSQFKRADRIKPDDLLH